MKKSLLSLMLFASSYVGAQTFTFTITTQGIQEWTVPTTGLYLIEAGGASGGNSTWSTLMAGGNGAEMSGEFTLTAGQVVNVLVGQVGESAAVGGGGGGSFVAIAGAPLLVAGGGGGASSDQQGVGAVTAMDGTYDSQSIIAGGTSGNGGLACMNVNGNNGGAGGGFYTDGASPNTGGASENNGFGGLSFLNGGVGAQPGINF